MTEEQKELVRKIFSSRKEDGCILTPRECDILVHHLLAYGKIASSLSAADAKELVITPAP